MNKFKEDKMFLEVKRLVTILVGAALMALAVNLVYEPMNMVTGGVSGLAIVVKRLTEPIIKGGLPVWLFTVLCNVPLYIYTFFKKGLKHIIFVLVGTIAFILALIIIPIFNVYFDDKLLASIIGGVINGLGIGMVFSAMSSTGGTDLLATLIQEHKRHFSTPQILIVIDGLVILIGALIFGIGSALYAIISIFISTKVSDGILEGLKFAKMAYIISEKSDEIANEIMRRLDRGVTSIGSKGMYSNKERDMLFCVVSRKQISEIIDISKNIDPKSFIIVNDVREVMGEGFIEFNQ